MHAGKGLLTLAPRHTDGALLSSACGWAGAAGRGSGARRARPPPRTSLAPHPPVPLTHADLALGGILAVLHCGLDARNTVAGRTPQALFFLAPALRPRMLMTVDEEGAALGVPVRVGQAVDVVAQAGRPKTVTGFQTHTTPVLLAAGERAELATSKYIALAPVLEGVVILKPNPDYVEVDHE